MNMSDLKNYLKQTYPSLDSMIDDAFSSHVYTKDICEVMKKLYPNLKTINVDVDGIQNISSYTI